MATAFVTLDSLPGADPSAEDNSAAAAGTTGATAPSAGTASAGDTSWQGKVAELEGLIQRHRQQLTGSQEEVQRLRRQVEALQQNTPLSSAAPPAKERIKFSEAVRKLELEDDASLLDAWEQDTVQQAQEAARQAAAAQTGQQDTRQALQQAIVQRHGELLSDAAFAQQVGARYQELAQDPLTRTLHPEDQQYVFAEPQTGQQYDMRILMQAANEVKAAKPAATRPRPSTLGVTNGGGTPPPATGQAIPKAWVEPGGIFADPQVQQVMRNLGYGGNTRTQVQNVLKHLSPRAKANLERGQ